METWGHEGASQGIPGEQCSGSWNGQRESPSVSPEGLVSPREPWRAGVWSEVRTQGNGLDPQRGEPDEGQRKQLMGRGGNHLSWASVGVEYDSRGSERGWQVPRVANDGSRSSPAAETLGGAREPQEAEGRAGFVRSGGGRRNLHGRGGRARRTLAGTLGFRSGVLLEPAETKPCWLIGSRPQDSAEEGCQ